MTRTEEYQFLTNFTSAMRRSQDVSALRRLFDAYEDQISDLSAPAQTELQRARAEREKELRK